MKSILYEQLPSLRNDELEDLTCSNVGFVVIANSGNGAAISAFLKNERKYSMGKKTFLDRIQYVWEGRVGFSIVPFISVWNNALVKGLEVKSIEDVNWQVYCRFGRRND